MARVERGSEIRYTGLVIVYVVYTDGCVDGHILRPVTDLTDWYRMCCMAAGLATLFTSKHSSLDKLGLIVDRTGDFTFPSLMGIQRRELIPNTSSLRYSVVNMDLNYHSMDKHNLPK